MSTIGTSPSNNGRGSEAWSGSWTHFTALLRGAAANPGTGPAGGWR
jgi:hypothetical protein